MPNLPKPDETWPESAIKANQTLVEIVTKLSEQVDELQRQLKLNSKTSSKPPSTDRNRRPTKKSRSGRAKGGQQGHKGSTRSLVEPDEVIHCQPSDEHCSCGGAWVGREAFTRIQVTDILEIQPTVTEYHKRCFSCARCGRETYARASLPLGESRFGPKIHAFVLDLNLGSRLSYR